MKRIANSRADVVFVLCATTAIALPAQTLTTLHSFNGADGEAPQAALVQGTDGNLYGTTAFGGVNSDGGTVFKITPDGTLTTLYSFCAKPNCADGRFSVAALVQGLGGYFYGTTEHGGTRGTGTVFQIAPQGALTNLYSFCSNGCRDGAGPVAGLVQATNRDFYGTAAVGGTHDKGTVFKITPSGILTSLHSL
jgi:uncharacterized repeat protein (TIGR03803 family)